MASVLALLLGLCGLTAATGVAHADTVPAPPAGADPVAEVLDGAPVDPVVEEPLRPLFAVTPSEVGDDAARCGSMGIAMLPVALIMLCIFRTCPSRRFRRF